MQRELGNTQANGRADSPNNISPEPETIDCLIIGAGFAGCYILYKLRKAGFTAKIIETGSGLGGIWHWNA